MPVLPPEVLPPIIDREILFGDPEISGAQLSPDGKYIAFLKPWKETRNIWVKQTGEPFSSARLMTTETARPVAGFLWTRDGKYIAYVKDNAGDENFNVYAVDPSAAAAEGSDAPPSRDLTNLKGVRVMLFSAPKTDPDVIYIGLNDRDPSWHDLYKLRISTGERTLIRQNTDRIAAWIFDLKGNLRLAQRVQDSGDQEILRVDPDSFTPIYTCNVFETCDPVQFHKDGQRVYIQTNKGALDLTTLILLDPATGQVETVESDPLQRVDLGSAWFSEASDELVATVYEDDRDRRYFKDQAFEADYRWLENELPGREISVVSNTLDERRWLINAHGDVEPGETYLFNRDNRTLAFEYKVREKLPRESLAPMHAIRYKSSDGLEIPAFLTLPKGVDTKSGAAALPALIVPHGGPWVRDEWGYNALAQFFANRGYAVLMPNFRGSTGYGKKFLNAGNGEWGTKMQDDLTWGVKYLVDEGIADPKRIGILGGSYGGYAALAGVAFTPDLYRAAVDIVGPSNLLTLLAAIPPYWEAGRKIMYARMADPDTPTGKQWMEERSPLYSAGKIKTPLMVVQGANDPRVNRREAEQIVIALRDRGFPVEYLLAPDEGHGFARPVNNLAMFMAVEKFLAAHLEGRYQEGGTPEVTARLREITVDPATVVISKKVDASTVGVPKVTADLKPGTYRYDAKISMGGQQMALKLSTTIEENAGIWTAVEEIDAPMGEMRDATTFQEGSLTVEKRHVRQGPVTIDVDFSSGRAVGTMNMNGEDKSISVDLDGPLFADAAGANFVIGCLPLEDGYTTVYRNFDVQRQKAKLIQLQVQSLENVTAPAGTFEAFKVELSSADGGPDKSTIWIAKDTRTPVKILTMLADMGGAVMTAELTSLD
jgi:dipeptidyl aminopeptidase/acylaminoacyl peptidase